MYPIKTTPIFKQYIWGGENLKTLYGKDIPGKPTAESWEVGCHPNGTSLAANGEYAGKPLTEVISSMGRDLVGENINPDEKFPLLLKVLDAEGNLSVQVHPEDTYAAAHENGEKGKTEMWYVLSAKPGAQLVYGFKEGVTKELYAKAIEEGTLEEILNYVDVSAGDVFFIPAGTVHAIGAGIIIAEMQQNSDTTYRVYDYNRVGADGKKRELHVEKALDVSDIACVTGREKAPGLVVKDGDNTITYYVVCNYFAFEKLDIAKAMQIKTNNKLHILFIAQGSGEIRYNGGSESFTAGESILIPAAMGEYEICGNCQVLKSYVPDKQKDIIKPLKELGYSDADIQKIQGIEPALL